MSVPGWFLANRARFEGRLLENEALLKHSYYRIGGPAALLAIPQSESDLEFLSEGIRATGAEFFVTGMGSNLLISDGGVAALVIKTTQANAALELAESGRVIAGASVTVTSFLRRAGQEGWGGFELLTGIPGAMGGVVAMNAGTHLGEAKDRLESVTAIDLATGEWKTYGKSELKFEYRRNLFLPPTAVVWESTWRFEPKDPAQVKSLIDETLLRRKTSQPLEYPSCGSVFKNPYESGKRAWEVIDQLKLRGHRIGNAQFSEKHPNFIVNLGGASSEDVYGLIQLAKQKARDELGVSLHEEVKYLPARS